MMKNNAKTAGFPSLALASIIMSAIAVFTGLRIAEIPGCAPWIGCAGEAVLVGVGLSFIGLILGIMSWKRSEARMEFALLGIIFNLLPILFVLWLFISFVVK